MLCAGASSSRSAIFCDSNNGFRKIARFQNWRQILKFEEATKNYQYLSSTWINMHSCVPPEEHYKRIHCTFFRFFMLWENTASHSTTKFQAIIHFGFSCFVFDIRYNYNKSINEQIISISHWRVRSWMLLFILCVVLHSWLIIRHGFIMMKTCIRFLNNFSKDFLFQVGPCWIETSHYTGMHRH